MDKQLQGMAPSHATRVARALVTFFVCVAAPLAHAAGVPTANPTSLTFANQAVSTTSASQSITITNPGPGNTAINSVSVTGTDSTMFAQTNNCPAQLGQAATCTITVTFTPTSTGSKTAAVTVTHNATGGTLTIPLSGTGAGPGISLSPTSLTFGNQRVGVTSASQSITVTNTGNSNLVVSGISLTGADTGMFAQTNNCATVAPAGTCTIGVTFTPGSTGAKSASVSITHNASGSPTAAALSGTGTTPVISVSPANVAFGNQRSGTTSASQTVTVSNTGTATLTVGGATFTGTDSAMFGLTNNCTTVAPGGNCTILVTFSPSSTGAKTASLSITHDASGSPSAVPLTGTGTQPAISLDTASLGFGNQLTNATSAGQTVTISNTGTAPLAISGITLGGTDAAMFGKSTTCGATVAAAGSCTVTVTFTPTSLGAKTATLSVAHDAAGSPSTVSLGGTGVAPAISVSPSSLSFGSHLAGTTSASQAVTVSNTGTAPLHVSGVTLTGANAAVFFQANDCTTVAIGGSCTIDVTFSPNSTGAKVAAVSIAHDAAGSPSTVDLDGSGVAPAISVTPDPLPFGNQLINTSSASQDVTISNTGSAALSITSITFGGADAALFTKSTTCGASVAAGASCTVTLTFTPTTTGAKTASLNIAHSAPSSPTSVALTGTGTAPAISVDPGSLDFSSVRSGTTSAAQTITITNSGTAPLTISSLSLSGADAAMFAKSSACAVVAAGDTCSVSVTFSPTSVGAKAASLSIAHDASGSPASVSLAGTGTAPDIGISPSSVAFGNQFTGTTSAGQVVTISNPGTSALAITGITFTGGDAAMFGKTTTCGASVAAGGSCTVTVTFSPTSVGAKTAALSIAHDATGSPSTVNLTGTGTAPSVEVDVSSLAFGSHLVGSTSASQTVTLTNAGGAALTITSITISGADAAMFAKTTTCGAAVAAGASCTISVTFAPASIGAKSATLSIDHDAPGSPSLVSFSGTGTAPAISVSPASHDFGDQLTGTTSGSQTFTVSNTGNAPLTITGISLSGTDAAMFAKSSACTTVSAGGTCTISVTFTPATAGAKTASLDIAHDAAGSPTAVALTGNGTAPVVIVINDNNVHIDQGTTYDHYSFLTASGGKSPYSYVADDPTLLPAGILLNTDGTLSGTTCSKNGNFTFNATATDANEATGAGAVTLIVNAKPNPYCDALHFSSSALPEGIVGTSYSYDFGPLVGGGTSPYTIALSSGTLPTGLTLTNAGVLSGTASAAGTFTFTLSATDSKNPTPASVSQTFSITINAAAAISVSPASVPFGNQAVNTTSASQTVTVTNTGGTVLNISAVTLTGADLALFAQTNDCTAVAPAATCTINVTFSPTSTGNKTASISITHDAAGSPTLVPLTGKGTAPGISVSPAALPFGDQPVGSTATKQTVTVTNTGTAALTISGIAFSGTDAAMFAKTTDCGSTLVAGASCAIDVTFTPSTAGAKTASLVITHDATGSPTTVPLTGNGTVAQVSIDSSSLAFGDQVVGTTSSEQTVTVTNTGGAPLTISGVTLTGGDAALYAQTNDCASVAAGGTCTIHVTFAPTSTGAKSASVSIAHDASGSPTAVSLGGNGVAPSISVSPASLAFADQITDTSSDPKTVTITNTGTSVLALTSLTLTGTDAALFGKTTTCAATLAAGASCTVSVTFAPTSTGAKTASLSIAHDATGSPTLVALTGSGAPPLAADDNDPVPPVNIDQNVEPFIPVQGSGGVGPYTYAISPDLPAGMTFDPATGQVSGKPTESKAMTTYTVTITDAKGAQATQDFQMEVLVYVVDMSPKNSDLGRAGLPAELVFTGLNGVGPYTFTVESGTLPGGMTLASGGRLSGRPASQGSYVVQMRVTDSTGATNVYEVTMTVDAPRPDPTLDEGVRALQQAEADSIRRFGLAQTQNTVRRLEQLRACAASSNDLDIQLQGQGSVPLGQLAQDAKQANCEQARSVWMAGTVTYVEGIDGASRLNTDGLTVGFDLRVTEALRVGAGVGYSMEGNSRLAGGAKLSGDGYNGLAYASWRLVPRVFVEGLVGYGNASYDTSRIIAEDRVTVDATRDASHWFGSLGIAGDLQDGNLSLQPYLRADYQSASFDGYVEHTPSSLALQYDSSTTDTTRWTGGVRANWTIEAPFGSVEPMLRLEYRGENRSGLRQGMRYADGLDGIDYLLRTSSGTESAGIVGAGIGLRLLNGLSAEFEYQTSFGSDLPDEESLGAILNWSF